MYHSDVLLVHQTSRTHWFWEKFGQPYIHSLQDTNLKTIQFLSKATGNDGDIGHMLTSCTTELNAAKCEGPALSHIVLVDTPGFDCRTRTDLEVPRLVFEWLNKR